MNGGTVTLPTDWFVTAVSGTGHSAQHGGTINTNIWLVCQNAGSQGDYLMDETLSDSVINTTDWFEVGWNGVGKFHQVDGEVHVGSDVYISENKPATGYGGEWIMDNGIVTTTGFFWIASGTSSGHFQQSNGSVSVSNYASIAKDPASVGVADISGGTFTSVGDFNVADYGNGTLNQTGGDIRTTGSTGFVIGYQAGAVGVANISAGSVTAGNDPLIPGSSDIRIGNIGTGTLNLSGGTMASCDWAYVGTNSGGNGTFNLSGTGLFKPGDNMAIGLNANTNGLVTMTGGTIEMIGNDPSAASSTSFGTGNLIVGRSGTGTLNMSAGTINVSVTNVTETFNSASASVDLNTGGFGRQIAHALDGNLYVGERNGVGAMTQSGGTTNVGAQRLRRRLPFEWKHVDRRQGYAHDLRRRNARWPLAWHVHAVSYRRRLCARQPRDSTCFASDSQPTGRLARCGPYFPG